VDVDLNNEPLGYDPNLEPVYLKDLWPTNEEIFEVAKPCAFTRGLQKVTGKYLKATNSGAH